MLEAEGVAFEPAALRHLAKGAAGSMRDALSLLDQAIAHGAGKVEDEGVRAMLGTLNWTLTWYRPNGEMSMEQIADQIADLLFKGLSAK